MDKYGETIQLLQIAEKAVGREMLACDRGGQKMGAKVLPLPQQKAAGVIRLAVSQRD
ncbi:hypothetical protein OJE16_20800 [Pantoea tagorei]